MCEASLFDSCPPTSEPRSLFLPHSSASYKKSHFPGLLRSSSPYDSLRMPIQCLYFNGFIPLPHSMADQSPLPHSNSCYYSPLSGCFPLLGITLYLRHSYAHYSSQTSIYKRNLFVFVQSLSVFRTHTTIPSFH